MLDFRKKRKIARIIYSPITLIVLVIIFVFVFRGAWNVYTKEKLSRINLDREKIELQRLIDREKNLASSLEYLKTDQGVENEIRSKFRAVKDGEKVAVIVNDEATDSISTTSTSTKRGFWYRIFHWF